jgi:hypothetical protein
VDAAAAKLVADLRAAAHASHLKQAEHQEAAEALRKEKAALLGRVAAADARAADATEAARAEALKINTDLAGVVTVARKEIDGLTGRLANVTSDAASRAATVDALKAELKVKEAEGDEKVAEAMEEVNRTRTQGGPFAATGGACEPASESIVCSDSPDSRAVC